MFNDRTADTPAKRIGYAIELLQAYPEERHGNAVLFALLVRDFLKAVPSAALFLDPVTARTAAGDYEAAIRGCAALIAYEAKLFEIIGGADPEVIQGEIDAIRADFLQAEA